MDEKEKVTDPVPTPGEDGQAKTTEEILATLPKDAYGTVIVSELTVEQKAAYYEHRSNEQAKGFNDYKETQSGKMSQLEAQLEALRNPDGTVDNQNTQAYKALEEKIATLEDALLKTQEETGWKKDWGEIISKPEYKSLEKRQEEFKAFAYKPENAKVPLDILADAYITRNKLNAKDEDKPQPRGLEEGGQGGGKPKQAGTYTSAEVKAMRENDYDKYIKLLRSKKLIIQD